MHELKELNNLLLSQRMVSELRISLEVYSQCLHKWAKSKFLFPIQTIAHPIKCDFGSVFHMHEQNGNG